MEKNSVLQRFRRRKKEAFEACLFLGAFFPLPLPLSFLSLFCLKAIGCSSSTEYSQVVTFYALSLGMKGETEWDVEDEEEIYILPASLVATHHFMAHPRYIPTCIMMPRTADETRLAGKVELESEFYCRIYIHSFDLWLFYQLSTLAECFSSA